MTNLTRFILRSTVSNSFFFTKSFSSKSNLFLLRKKTGLPIKLCKESLEKNQNDIDKSLEWLDQESIRLGINKAEKLSGRDMNSGLLGLIADSTTSAVMEINCETDFVSRNQGFQSLLHESTNCLFKFAKGSNTAKLWNNNELGELKLNSLLLNDMVVKLVNEIGENIQIRRGYTIDISKQENSFLTNYSHISSASSTTSINQTKFGKYVSIIKYRCVKQDIEKSWTENANKVTRQLCQHIIGMNPTQSLEINQAETNPDKEKCIWHQQFFLDENITIKKLLEDNSIELLDFVRLECGAD